MLSFVKKFLEVYKPLRVAMLGVFVFITFSQGINIITPYLSGKIIDALVNKRLGNEVYLLAVLTFVLWIIRTILGYARDRYELKYIDYSIPERMHSVTLSRLLNFSIGQHTSEHSGIKQSVIGRGKEALISIGDMILYQIIPLVSEIVIMTGTLLYCAPELGFIVLVGLILYVIFVVKLNNHFRKDFKEVETRYIDDSKFQQEVLQNIGLVIAPAQETRAYNECSKSFSDANNFNRSIWIRFCGWVVIRSIIPSVTHFCFLLVGIYFVLNEKYSVGQLVMFLSWGMNTLGSLGNIGSIHRKLIQSYNSAKRYFDMLDIEPDVKVIENPVKPEKFLGQIEFKNVSFYYKRRDVTKGEEIPKEVVMNPALDGISFIIPAGQTVAIVGESGAGKSTIVKALLRAQDPSMGQIIINGNDLRILDLKRFRESIGLVDQDVSLFDQTIRYNITYGLNGRGDSISDKELHRVAEMACIDRFFHRLEKGFDTLIGERGVKLSGGERQRVGIARALIKEPDILIFDEATSNLDSENESIIRQSIKNASIGRTTIIVAHRFSTIREVDRVLVFDRGRLVGDGTHNELAQSCAEYQRLVKKQTF